MLEMFESPLFDIHMILRYLYTHGNRPNILEYLVNKYGKNVEDNKVMHCEGYSTYDVYHSLGLTSLIHDGD